MGVLPEQEVPFRRMMVPLDTAFLWQALVLSQTASFDHRRACDCLPTAVGSPMAAYADCGRMEGLLNQSLPPDSALVMLQLVPFTLRPAQLFQVLAYQALID
jgi:hypothetical protein